MKKLITLFVIFNLQFSIFNSTQAQNNGYSLEFEDVVTLSVESSVSVPAGSSSKTYTVPANCVLKISSGCVMTSGSNFVTYLSVGNEIIKSVATKSGSNSSPWQTIWASAGTVITLTYTVTNTNDVTCGYISGTLYKKVAN